jgi:hypothetical protein
MKINNKFYVTIGGQGLRMKAISPKEKHLLYYKNRRIIDWILHLIPDAKLLGATKTLSRKHTLQEIKNEKNVVIIDCDIIPFGIDLTKIDFNSVYVFNSDKKKYGSVIVENNIIKESNEKENISNIKCSGIYCVKDIDILLKNMEDNSIVSGMIGAKAIYENTFKRFGDVEDYYESISE